MRYFACALVVVLLVAVSAAARADPVFYEVEGNHPGGDLAFQAGVAGHAFHEVDFDAYARNQRVDGVFLDGVFVDFSVPGTSNESPRVFWGGYPSGGGVYGTVWGGALVKEPQYGAQSFQFTFTGDSVVGFGIWLFSDDAWTDDAYRLVVEDVAGDTWTSGLIDVPSNRWEVEGFLGVTSDVGLRRATVVDSVGAYFELDHMQVALRGSLPIPEPTTLALFGLGAGALALRRRRRKLA